MREHRPVQLQDLGFRAWCGAPAVMGHAHVHSDVELNLPLTGGATYFHGGRFHELGAGQLTALWAGVPHQLVRVLPRTTFIWVTVPLAWLLQWRLPPAFVETLLSGATISAAADSLDRQLLERWVDDMVARDPALERVVALEVEARLHRLALTARRPSPAPRPPRPGQLERITRYVGDHYHEPLTVPAIAAAVHLHPNYAMQLFRRHTGMRLWDYVTQLRIAHAQRMLLGGDAKMLEIAMEAGFGSASRFYAVFRHHCGCTPRQFRIASDTAKRPGNAGSRLPNR